MTHTQRPIGSGMLAGMQSGVSPAQRAIAQEMQVLMREIYIRAASDLLMASEPWPDVEHYRNLAAQAKTAARAYFEGLGVIQPEAAQVDESSPE